MIDGEAKDLINDSRAGKCVKPDDVNGMIKILKNIIKNKNSVLLNRSKINTKEYVNKHFNRSKLLNKLIDIFKNISLSKNKIKLITNTKKLPF